MTDLELREPSALYVDAENLQADAKELLVSLLDNWPVGIPVPTKVVLYVRADLVELWRMWALANIDGRVVEVHGIQHYAVQQSKNSADIAIAVEVICDLLKGTVRHAAVFSDDSDFISLFAKVRAETKDIQSNLGKVPFLWILTDRSGTKSPHIQQFFPEQYLHVVRQVSKVDTSQPLLTVAPENSVQTKSLDDLVAEAVIREIGLGEFKSLNCQEIVRAKFPSHPGVNQSGSSFGEYVSNKIWPLLEVKGVELVGDKPRRYKMTQEAKNSIIPA